VQEVVHCQKTPVTKAIQQVPAAKTPVTELVQMTLDLKILVPEMQEKTLFPRVNYVVTDTPGSLFRFNR
jgi:hypothetical protein